MITNEITEQAGLLADAIARSSELAELRRTEDAMTADESAQKLIAELQKAQERFMEKQQGASEPSEADKDLVDEIEKKGIDSVIEFFGCRLAKELVLKGVKADLLLGNNVLAHVPDIVDFVGGLKIILKE